jgi:hypothetical protein
MCTGNEEERRDHLGAQAESAFGAGGSQEITDRAQEAIGFGSVATHL